MSRIFEVFLDVLFIMSRVCNLVLIEHCLFGGVAP